MGAPWFSNANSFSALNVTDCVREVVVITQSVCSVFGGSMDRQVDRIRLRNSVENVIGSSTNGIAVTNRIVGLQVDKVTYLTSNRVEAVFSYVKVSPK